MKTVVALALCLASFGASFENATAGDYTSKTITVGVRKNMEATLYTPNGSGPFPMVIVLHTSGGISSFDLSYCGALAKEGYICIAPAFLRAHAITNETRQLTFTKERAAIIEDFKEIIGELNQLPTAKKGAVGMVGFSNGGYFAALFAGSGGIKAGVSYYGTFTGAQSDPALKRMNVVFCRTAESPQFQNAPSPLLILAGENDGIIGAQVPRQLESILKACGRPYEIKMYPGVGHDFDRLGGNPAAAADAWQRTLAFLRANGV
jgi:carboxymethylenebutenolidase